MIYLILVFIVMVTGFSLTLSTFIGVVGNAIHRKYILLTLMIMIAVLMISWIVVGPIFALLIKNSYLIDLNNDSLVAFLNGTKKLVYITLIGSIIFSISVSFLYTHFKRTVILAITSATLISYSAVDHLIFVHDSKMTGTLNYSLFREVLGDDGFNCQSDLLLINWDETKDTPVKYRCPNSVVFGELGTFEPYVPWPDYTQGESIKLSQAMYEALQSAKLSQNK